MADKLGYAQHTLRRLAALLMVNSGHGFFRAEISTAFSPEAFQFVMAAARRLPSSKPLKDSDRRTLGSPLDLVSQRSVNEDD
jgi:hypothetical protein